MTQSWIGHNNFTYDSNFIAHIERLNPASLLFCDNDGGAQDAARRLPDCKVIARHVSDQYEKKLHYTRGETLRYLQKRASQVDRSCYINLGCEPPTDRLDLLVSEYLEALEWAAPRGIKVAAPHLAHYGLDERHWPTLAPLAAKIGRHSDIFLWTVDEYFAAVPFSGVADPTLPEGNERGHIRPETWKRSPVGVYYHCGRIFGLFKYMQSQNMPLPLTVITEGGPDGLQDVKAFLNSLKVRSPHTEINGWLSLYDQWAEWGKPYGWTPQQYFVNGLKAHRKEIYEQYPNVIAYLLYIYGRNGDATWLPYDTNDGDLLREIEQARVESKPPVTYPPKHDKPTNLGAPVAATLLEDYNLREGPGKAYRTVVLVKANAAVTYYPNQPDKTIADGFTWGWVETADGKSGFMAYQTQFRTAPALPSWWPTDERALGVPFQTQRGTGTNNCGEASLTMVLRYWMARRGLPGDVDVTDIISAVNNNGGYATFDDLIRAAHGLGLTLHQTIGMTGAALVNEIRAGRPVIALVERGKLPGAQAYYAFTGAHFVVVHTYDATGFLLHDPLSYADGAGVNLHVAANDFMAAWESTSGNAGHYQALTMDETALEPTPPDDEEPPVVTPIDVLKEQVWVALDAWMEADKAAGEAIAEASLKAAAFKSLHAQYMALKQESATPELTLVKDTQGEAA
jgi:hypothetical protein